MIPDKPFGLFEIRLLDLGGIVGVTAMVITYVVASGANGRALFLEKTTRR